LTDNNLPAPGTQVCYRASAVNPLDPQARWRGTVTDDPPSGTWVQVKWRATDPNSPVRSWVDAALLAVPGSVAANDRHHKGPAHWPAANPEGA